MSYSIVPSYFTPAMRLHFNLRVFFHEKGYLKEGPMKFIEPYANLVKPLNAAQGIDSLRFIEAMARISHRTEEAQTEDSWKRFLQAVVIERGDWSVTEHGTASVIFRIDRGLSHEIVRHRHFSFTQESTRFVNPSSPLGRKIYPQGPEFIYPQSVKGSEYDARFRWALEAAECFYIMLLESFPPQIARAVLPNSLATTVGMTGNFRAWRHFFLMRTTKEAHPDLRRVVDPLLATFKERIPLLYDDIESGARQIDNLRRAE